MIKKVHLTVFILFSSIVAFSQVETQTQSFEKLDAAQVVADVKEIKQEMDSTFYYISATCKILKEEVEIFGWKKTIQMNSDIFLPFVIMGILYLLWLKGRKST